MDRIYSTARQVFAFLGSGFERQFVNDGLSDIEPILSSSTMTNTFPIHIDMVGQTYWTRVWIVQELRLAKHVLFWYGSVTLEREQMIDICQSLHLVRAFPEQTGPRSHGQLYSPEFLQRSMSRIVPLLQEYSSPHDATWIDILEKYCDSDCNDSRDKIYGLQSLVHPRYRIPVSYSKSLRHVLHEVARKILCDSLQDLLGKYTSWPLQCQEWGMLVKRVCSTLSRVDPDPDLRESIRVLAWATMIPQLSKFDWKYTRSEHDEKEWRCLWHFVSSHAATNEQCLLAVDFEDNCGVSCNCDPTREHRFDARLPICSEITQLPNLDNDRLVKYAGSAYGFCMYGQFLCHPKDWPFPDEEPTTTFARGDRIHWNWEDIIRQIDNGKRTTSTICCVL